MASPHLPAEILEQIFQYTPLGDYGQLDHCSICLVSRSWYASAIKRLYDSPSIIGKNFDAFARTLCPSVNANVRRTELALFVRRLDMSKLVYNGSKSLTARVLGRVKGQLEVFIAPAATFSLLAFSALAKCEKLKILNLEYVIERIDAVLLLRTVGKLRNLERLALRMAWMSPQDISKPKHDLGFPDSLRHLTISGLCEPEGATLLYKAMERSKIDSLSLAVSGQHQEGLTRAVYGLKLKKLHLDIGSRQSSQDWEASVGLIIPELLYHCNDVEELSIPLVCLSNIFFTTSGLSRDPPYALRHLIVHSSSIEVSSPLLQNSEWDQLVRNVQDGHIRNLEEITVFDTKDVAKFVELEQEETGRFNDLDQALYNEEFDRGGLFLEGVTI